MVEPRDTFDPRRPSPGACARRSSPSARDLFGEEALVFPNADGGLVDPHNFRDRTFRSGLGGRGGRRTRYQERERSTAVRVLPVGEAVRDPHGGRGNSAI